MQTTFPELASSMGKVIPLAGALTVKQEDLFGAMSTLTGVTGNTAEVSTQLRGVMQGLLKPSDSMSSALEEMGFKSGGAAIESLGLQGTLEGLKGTVKGNDTELLNMFGSVEAGGAVLALTGAQADNFTAKTKAMGEATGATEDAFKIQQATVSAMMAKMKASFDVVMITLGEKLLPIFNRFLTFIIDHMPQIQNFIDKAMQVAGVAFKFVGDFITNTLIPAFKAFWDWIQPYMPQIKDAVVVAFDLIKGAFKLVGDYITKIVIPIYKGLAEWFFKNFPLMKDAVKKAYDYIKPSFDNLVQVIRDSVMPIIDGLWGVVKKAMPGIKSVFEIAMPLIVVAVKLAIDIIAVIIKAVKGIYDLIKPGLDKVATLFSTVFGGIKKVIDGVQWVLDKFNRTKMSNKSSTVNTKYTSSGSSSQYGGVGRNANGTDNWRGGLSWVGERGPELVNLPKGSQVIPNGKSMDMASSNTSKTPVTIQLVLQNGKAISEFLIDDINKLIGNENKVGSRGMGI